MIILFSGMQFARAQTDEAPITMRCAIESFTTSNPLNADADSWKVLSLIYEGATKNNPVTGERVPYIAVGSANESRNTYVVSWSDCMVGNFGYSPKETWEDPAKPEIIIFYDFEDVHWQDGVQMNVRDIMFSFHVQASSQVSWLGHPLTDQAGESNSNYSETHWLFIQKIWESEDQSRAALKFVLQKPFFSVFDHYLSSYILPYHIWGNEVSNQAMNDTKIWCDAGYNRSDIYSWKPYYAIKWKNLWPIGSGPFSWAGMSNNKISLVPWNGHFYRPGFKYFLHDAGIVLEPSIDVLSLKIYTSEEQALMDLEADRIDYIAWGQPLSVVSRFADNSDITYTSLKSLSMTYMGYNMKRKSFGYIRELDGQTYFNMDYGKPLRKALAHGINTLAISAISNPVTMGMDSLATFKSWENTTAPSYSFDPAEAIKILENAGYILDDPASPPGNGNWWSNPDGSPIGSAPGGKLELLVTSFENDSVRFQIGTLVVNQMRDIGINAELTPMWINDLLIRLDEGDYDMCLNGQDCSPLQAARPEVYYFGSFHSETLSYGPNICGYSNESFDEKINLAMSTTDLELERLYVHDAMASIAYDTPITPLYYVSNMEVYRSSNFDGLLDDGSGSLLNPRSMASAVKQEKAALRSKFIGISITGMSNSTRVITVRVTDQNGNLVMGAEVKLEVSAGYLLNTSGITDQNGQFSTNYTAPYVPLVETYNNWEPVKIKMISATLDGYRNAPAMEFTITIFPERMRTMFVEASVDPDVIIFRDGSGNPGFANINLQARDMGGIPIEGVALLIAVNGTNATLSASEVRTDSGGRAAVRVFAPNVNITAECRIIVNATKAGFFNASQEIAITIAAYVPETPEPPVPMLNRIAVPLAIVLISSVLIGAAYFVRRRRRRKK